MSISAIVLLKIFPVADDIKNFVLSLTQMTWTPDLMIYPQFCPRILQKFLIRVVFK